MIKSRKSTRIKSYSPIDIYERTIEDTPKHTCTICHVLHFRKDMRTIKEKVKQIYYKLVKSDNTILTDSICRICFTNLKQSKLPKYATPSNIRTNKPLHYVQNLSLLEERLVSLRIAFAQIWELGYKRSQIGLTSSIINVPVNMNIIQKALSQPINSTPMIVVYLKRRL